MLNFTTECRSHPHEHLQTKARKLPRSRMQKETHSQPQAHRREHSHQASKAASLSRDLQTQLQTRRTYWRLQTSKQISSHNLAAREGRGVISLTRSQKTSAQVPMTMRQHLTHSPRSHLPPTSRDSTSQRRRSILMVAQESTHQTKTLFSLKTRSGVSQANTLLKQY